MVENFVEEYELNIKKIMDSVETIREVLPRIEMFEYMREISNQVFDLDDFDDFKVSPEYQALIQTLKNNYSFDEIRGKDCDVCFITNITRRLASDFIKNIDEEINNEINDMDLEEDLS